MTRKHGVAYLGFYVIGSVGASSRGCQSFHNAAVHREGTLVVYAVTDAVNINSSGVYGERCAVFKLDAVIGVYHRADYASAVHNEGCSVVSVHQNLCSAAAAYDGVIAYLRGVLQLDFAYVENSDTAAGARGVVRDFGGSSDEERQIVYLKIDTAAALGGSVVLYNAVYDVAVSAGFGINAAAVFGFVAADFYIAESDSSGTPRAKIYIDGVNSAAVFSGSVSGDFTAAHFQKSPYAAGVILVEVNAAAVRRGVFGNFAVRYENISAEVGVNAAAVSCGVILSDSAAAHADSEPFRFVALDIDAASVFGGFVILNRTAAHVNHRNKLPVCFTVSHVKTAAVYRGAAADASAVNVHDGFALLIAVSINSAAFFGVRVADPAAVNVKIAFDKLDAAAVARSVGSALKGTLFAAAAANDKACACAVYNEMCGAVACEGACFVVKAEI